MTNKWGNSFVRSFSLKLALEKEEDDIYGQCDIKHLSKSNSLNKNSAIETHQVHGVGQQSAWAWQYPNLWNCKIFILMHKLSAKHSS